MFLSDFIMGYRCGLCDYINDENMDTNMWQIEKVSFSDTEYLMDDCMWLINILPIRVTYNVS